MRNGLPADASRPGLLKYIEYMVSMVGYFGLKTPLKMRLTQKTRRLFIFPGISHFEGIGQGGISREIPPGKYRPGISQTTLVGSTVSSCGKHCAQMLNIDNTLSYSHDNPNTLKHHLQVDCVAILHWFEENNM